MLLPRRGPETRYVSTIGLSQIAGAQMLHVYKPRHWINCGQAGPLGWTIPAALGVRAADPTRKIVALSGDYPVTGHKGLAAPVFDIDSVGLLSLFSEMNSGLRDERKPGQRLDRTAFFLGCVVTNHKRYEREVVPQYLKLRKKVENGARFVIKRDSHALDWIARVTGETIEVSPALAWNGSHHLVVWVSAPDPDGFYLAEIRGARVGVL